MTQYSTSSNRTDFIGGLNQAARDNPISAALIGAGIAWMFFGTSKGSFITEGAKSALTGLSHGAQFAGSGVYHGVRATGEGLASAVSTAGGGLVSAASTAVDTVKDATLQGVEKLGAAAGASKDSLTSAASDITNRASEAYRNYAGEIDGSASATNAASQMGERAQAFSSEAFGTLKELFASQPLLLGVVGLAVGAAIAATAPITDTEEKVIGNVTSAAKQKASDLLKKADEFGSKALDAATAQGLGAPAVGGLRSASEALASVAEKALEKASDSLKR
jgi:hypothetical protein